MRRLFIVLLAAVGLIAATVAPAAGQDDNPLTINPDSGVPGDLVAAHVDPQVVADNCITDFQDFQAMFATIPEPGPIFQGWLDSLHLIDWDRFETPENEEQWTAQILQVANVGVWGFLTGDDEPAQQLLAASFVLTFVDIATQEPVGDPHTFDPNTGEGTIPVPDLDPGLWAIAATCVEPEVTDESFLAALDAGMECLRAEFGDDWADDPIGEGFNLVAAAEACGAVMLAELMVPQEGAGPWVQPFSIPGPGVAADPAVEAFCGVLPELSPLGEEITAALADLPEDDGEMSDEEWAESEDWDAIEAELRELFGAANELMAIGDETRADEVAPQWEIVTASLRQATEALEAVDYDLSTPSGRQIAGELRAGATADGDNTESEAATAVLTQWFLDNCIPAAPPAEVPVEETPRAAPAPVAVAQPTFTG